MFSTRRKILFPQQSAKPTEKLKSKLPSGEINKEKLLRDVRHILRLDDDLSEFYKLTKKDFAWLSATNTGRMLRSPTVFEDLVKTICTTNCSWALTKKMTTNLVEKLGTRGKNGKRAFPTAEQMANKPVEFYKNEIRAGYRSLLFCGISRIRRKRKNKSRKLARFRFADERIKKANEANKRCRRLRGGKSSKTRRTLRRTRARFVAAFAIL